MIEKHILFILIFALTCTFSSPSIAQKKTIDWPIDIKWEHRAPILEYLRNEILRLPDPKEIAADDGSSLAIFQMTRAPRKNPFYLVDDFNRDGVNDFVIAFIHTGISEFGESLKSCEVAVFESNEFGTFDKKFVQEAIASPAQCRLDFDAKKRRILVTGEMIFGPDRNTIETISLIRQKNSSYITKYTKCRSAAEYAGGKC